MELPRGITGFQYFRDPPLPLCDIAAFRSHCHAAARAVGGRVLRSPRRPDGMDANFALALLDVIGGPVAVLLNCHFPVVAIAVPPRDGRTAPLEFIDALGLADIEENRRVQRTQSSRP